MRSDVRAKARASKSSRTLVRRKYAWAAISVVFVLVVAVILARSPFFASADLAVFYPGSCLGGWTNPQHASGAASLSGGVDPEEFTPDNSAVLDGAAAQIFCGGFTGTIPSDSLPKKAMVSFVWTMKQHQIPAASVPSEDQDQASQATTSTQTITVTPDSATSSLEQALDSTSTDDVHYELLLPPTTTVNENGRPAQSASTSETASPPTENTSGNPGPTSFLDMFVAKAHAQESQATTSSGQTASAGSLYSILNATSEDFLEVSYTIDGVTWHSLGKVNKDTLTNASFEIPAADVSRWEDVSKFQVSVQSLPTVDEAPAVYLDAVSLAVTYAGLDSQSPNADQQFVNLPKVEVDSSKLFKDPKKVFGAHEDPHFEMDLGTVIVAPPVSTASSTAPSVSATSSDNENALPVAPITPSVEVPATATTTSASAWWGRALGLLFGSIPTASAQAPPPNGIVTASVIGPDGDTLPIEPILANSGTKISVTVPRPADSFRPGRYTLRVTFVKDGTAYTSSQDFKWGVLAINTDQSIYSPGQSAYLQMAVLNDTGHAVCKAGLRLSIDGPGGIHQTFSTEDGSIALTPDCRSNNVTDLPDFSAHFTPSAVGTYVMTLVDADNGNSITDSFEARDDVPFQVTRTGATRINPFLSTYVMHMHIVANQEFHGAITETVPSGFDISAISAGGQLISTTVSSSTQKNISWPADLMKGDELDLAYTYQAPLVSPEFYELGPLAFSDQATAGDVFTEARQWQIAGDAACTAAAATFNWSTGGSWTGCSGAGGIPAAADDLTIPSGAVITVDVASAVANSISFSAAAAATSITISGSNDLKVGGGTGAITFVAATGNTAAKSSTLAVAAGTLESGTITLNGGSSTGTTNLTLSTGTITVTGSITFVTNTVKAALTYSGAGNINVTVDFSSNGTLTTATGSTLTLNGTGEQKLGIYTTYKNVTINKATGVVSPLGAITIGGNLTITNGILADNAFQITGSSSGLFTMAAGTQLWVGTTTTATATLFPASFTAANTTLSAGSTVYYYANLAQTISGTPTYANITIATGASTVAKIAAAAMTVNGDITLSGPVQFDMGTSFSHTVKGNWVNNSTHAKSASSTAATVTFAGTSAQSIGGTVASTTFPKLTISNTSAAVSVNVNTNVLTTFTINASAVVTPAAAVVFNSVTTQGTITGSGNVQVTRTAATPDYSSQYKFTTNTLTNLTVDYAGTGAQTVSVVTYGHLLISNTSATVTLGGNLSSISGTTTVNANATLNSSAFTFGSTGNISVSGTWSGTGAITMSGTTKNIDGTGTISNTGLFTISTGAKTVMPTANLTIASPVLISGAITVTNNGTIISTSASGIWGSAAGSAWTQGANSNLSVVAAIMGTSTMTASASGNTVTYNGTSAAQSVKSATFYNLTIADTGQTASASSTITVGGAMTVSSGTYNANGKATTVTGLTTISGGTYAASTATQTFTGGLTLSSGTFTGSNGTVDVPGDITLNGGTFTATSGTFTVGGSWTEGGGVTFTPGSNTVTFNGSTGTQTISGTLTGANNDFNNVTFSGASAKTFSNNASTTNFTISSGGTVTAPALLTIAGNYSNSSAFANGGTIYFESGSAQTLGGTMTGSSDLGNVIFKGAGTKSFGANAASTTDFTIISGSGAVTAPSTRLTIGGDYSNAGTFTHNSGTVYFDSASDQSISGATTWFGLKVLATVARTVSFQSGVTQTIAANGNLTLNGASSQLLTLAPITPSSAWNLAVSTTGVTQSILYTSISYSDASGSASFNQQVNSSDSTNVDGGHTTNWLFLSLTFTVDASSQTFPTITAGTVSATSSILSVTTSNSTGFNVTIQRGDPTGTMSFGSIYIPDKTAWSAPVATTSVGNSTASTTEPLTLQFRVSQAGTDAPDYASTWWGTADTTASALFAGIPSSAQTIINRSTSAVSGTSMNVLYDVNVSAGQTNGTYSGSITYTVTANP